MFSPRRLFSHVRSSMLTASVVIALGAGFLILSSTFAGCDSDEVAPPSSAAISFRGVITGAGESGVFDVTAASPITGTLTLVGGPAINLAGDYNNDTGDFMASGGGYSLNGLDVSGTLTGTYTGDIYSGSISGFSSDQEMVEVYCGTSEGTSPGGPVFSVWNLARRDNALVGASVETDSSAAPGESGSITGLISGNSILLVGIKGSATGTLSEDGESMSGTWLGDEGSAGTWMGSIAACAGA